jgi:cell division protein FtsI (penicillin-binding protein 3)
MAAGWFERLTARLGTIASGAGGKRIAGRLVWGGSGVSPADRELEAVTDWRAGGPQDAATALSRLRRRATAVMLCFCGGFLLLAGKATSVALFRPVDPSTRQASAAASAEARADIVDRNGVVLARTLPAPSLYADPENIWDVRETATALRSVFPELDQADLEAKLARDSRFVWIKRRLTSEQRRQVRALAQPGLYFIEENRRFYPNGLLAGHVLGGVNDAGRGLMGVEAALDRQLAASGADGQIRLSIDARVQHVAEQALDEAVQLHRAIGGVALVMDARTGEMLASASWPMLDPAQASTAPPDVQLNRATHTVFEMGSTFKVFTVAAGLDEGVVSPEKLYDATRPLRIGNWTISDFHGQNRMMTVSDILAHSSNVGTVRIADEVGPERLRGFLERLGLLDRAGAELRGAAPLVPQRWSRIENATISYGHGINVSPISVMAAYSAIANSGVYIQPTYLARPANAPAPQGRQVVSLETSLTIVSLMREVVAHGTGRRAEAEGYMVAGKTGTANKPRPGGGYDINRRVSSFAGVFPADDPRYAVLVLLDEPKGAAATGGVATAGVAAAPAVSRIVSRSAPLLGVMPRTTLASLPPAGPNVQSQAAAANVRGAARGER